MKTAFYIILLLVEAAAGFLAINLAWTNLGWVPCVVTIAVWAVLLTWQLLMLTKAADVAHKQKICRRIALVMLVPIVGFIIMFIYWFIDLSSVI